MTVSRKKARPRMISPDAVSRKKAQQIANKFDFVNLTKGNVSNPVVFRYAQWMSNSDQDAQAVQQCEAQQTQQENSEQREETAGTLPSLIEKIRVGWENDTAERARY